MRNSTYHRVLRVSAPVCALALLFESGMVASSTVRLSIDARQYVANAVGMSASVEPTELNMLTAELTSQKLALASREAAVAEREIAVGLAGTKDNQNAIYILSSILFILLVLIILNYALDYLRLKEQAAALEQRTV